MIDDDDDEEYVKWGCCPCPLAAVYYCEFNTDLTGYSMDKILQ